MTLYWLLNQARLMILAVETLFYRSTLENRGLLTKMPLNTAIRVFIWSYEFFISKYWVQ